MQNDRNRTFSIVRMACLVGVLWITAGSAAAQITLRFENNTLTVSSSFLCPGNDAFCAPGSNRGGIGGFYVQKNIDASDRGKFYFRGAREWTYLPFRGTMHQTPMMIRTRPVGAYLQYHFYY